MPLGFVFTGSCQRLALLRECPPACGLPLDFASQSKSLAGSCWLGLGESPLIGLLCCLGWFLPAKSAASQRGMSASSYYFHSMNVLRASGIFDSRHTTPDTRSFPCACPPHWQDHASGVLCGATSRRRPQAGGQSRSRAARWHDPVQKLSTCTLAWSSTNAKHVQNTPST